MIPITDLRMQFAPDGTPISGEIVFSHVDDKTGKVRHFAIERIVDKLPFWHPQPEIIEFPIDRVFAAFMYKHRGLEQHRLERITPQQVAQYPVILAHMPGIGRDVGEHLIIDGSHRYFLAAMWGWETIRGYRLTKEMWEPYLVDVPDWLNAIEAEKLSNQHINPIDSRIA